MVINLQLSVCALAALLLLGCVRSGGIYRNVITPLSKDFDNTPVGTKHCVIQGHKLKEPISGYGISAEWDANNIRKAMQKSNMTKVYYMDQRTFSIFFDIYSNKQLILYGE